MVIGILCSHLGSLRVVEVLDTLIGLHVNLNIVEGAVRLGELVSVTGIAIHMPIGVWSSAVREELHNLMGRFLMG